MSTALASLTRFLVWSALILGVVIGVARITAIRWVRLPMNDPVFETSVLPTLEGGDLLLLWRLSQPTFGDLVLCPEPQFPDRYVVGRILGEGGDQVRLKDGQVFVNGKSFVNERSCDPPTIEYPHPDRDSEQVKQPCSWEDAAGTLHMVGGVSGAKISPFEQQSQVPEGHWFLVSDNRLFPYDSRDFGLVDKSTCKEIVLGRLVSRRGWTDSKRRMTYIQ